jgi:hypothetical protein
MLWIFPYLSVLKGNLSRSLGAISHGECFANTLPHFFSRENLKVENRRSVLWDEVDMGNEEIIGVATKFVKANCYSPNPNLF